MLNALSKPSEVNKLITEYEDKARYWFIKKQGGEKKYKQLFCDMMNKCLETRKTMFTEVVKYSPKKGVNWLVWGTVKYYECFNLPYFTLYAFLYYETAASIGGYMTYGTKNHESGEISQVIIYFSDHFFLRLKDRIGANATMQNVVKVFVGNVSEMVVMSGDASKGEKPELMVKFPDSYGFGRLKNDKTCRMFKFSTFLKRSELTLRKLRLVRKLDRLAKECRQYPPELEEMRKEIDDKLNEDGWTPDSWWKNGASKEMQYV